MVRPAGGAVRARAVCGLPDANTLTHTTRERRPPAQKCVSEAAQQKQKNRRIPIVSVVSKKSLHRPPWRGRAAATTPSRPRLHSTPQRRRPPNRSRASRPRPPPFPRSGCAARSPTRPPRLVGRRPRRSRPRPCLMPCKVRSSLCVHVHACTSAWAVAAGGVVERGAHTGVCGHGG
jgi:hypothetical protein